MNTLNNEQLNKLNETAEHINYDTDDVMQFEKTDKKRDWFLTINENAECVKSGQVSYENMKDYVLSKFHNCVYFCYDEEIGDTGNVHMHLYISFQNAISFSSIRNKFKGAHIESKKGSAFFAMNYVKKPKGLELQGKEKSHTQIKSFQEYGNFDDIEEKGKYNKDGTVIKKEKTDINKKLKDLVEQFNSLEEIAECEPSLYNLYHKTLSILMDIKRKNKLLESGITEKVESENGEEFYLINRNVCYIYGLNGCGKTYSVYKKYGFNNVGLVTFNKDNSANFDNYNNQDVLLIDDFSGNIPFSVLQHMTDSYIKPLDARYQDKKSYYSNCIFTSNVPFDELYQGVKDKNLDRYNSMLRRFTGGVWEVFQDHNGRRYIALHDEFLPSGMRFGNKFKNLENPLSKDFYVVSLKKLEFLKEHDGTIESIVKNDIYDIEYGFTVNEDGTTDVQVVSGSLEQLEDLTVPF